MCYKTLKTEGVGEHVAERSRFIVTAVPVQSSESAEEIIARVKKSHPNASHNVFAYILRTGNKRYSDDGEPQGTGGIPILEMLEKEGLVDLVVVVTRYFGGTLLGTGGLARAYTAAAKAGVLQAGTQTMTLCARLSLRADYSLYGKLSHMFEQTGATVGSGVFEEDVKLEIIIEKSAETQFLKNVTEISSGAVSPVKLEDFYAPR